MAQNSSQVKNQLHEQPVPQPQIHSELQAAHAPGGPDMKAGQGIHWNQHNPFEVSSYPMTNPPIIDSTFYLPYTNEEGIQRRRRISISNGQIGQIINHEALYADEELYDEMNDESFRYSNAPHDDANTNPHISNPVVPDSRMAGFEQIPLLLPKFVPRPPHQSVKVEDKEGIQPPQPQPPMHAHTEPVVQQKTPALLTQVPVQHIPAEGSAPYEPSMPGEITPHSGVEDVAGVPPPNHQLIYNNEVIYSADGGPIPGTAAWKKERLLERNRIAASKCRQRKKQAQQELQKSISKYEKEMKDQKDLIKKYEKLFAIYDEKLAGFFYGKGGSIDSLRQYVGKRIDDINL